ncbi:hypothetical protein AWQ22_08215 [Picosynechococcus sp. PCC 7117]|nr:hypothetical protein AWQ22_08215 [Picosynechococcus sp. PCC 7117]
MTDVAVYQCILETWLRKLEFHFVNVYTQVPLQIEKYRHRLANDFDSNTKNSIILGRSRLLIEVSWLTWGGQINGGDRHQKVLKLKKSG